MFLPVFSTFVDIENLYNAITHRNRHNQLNCSTLKKKTKTVCSKRKQYISNFVAGTMLKLYVLLG